MAPRLLEVNGETHTTKEWAKKAGISYQALCGRLDRGWDVEKAVSTPNQFYRTLEYNGVTHKIKEWAEIIGVSPATIHWRLQNGWSAEDALRPIKDKHRNQTKRRRRICDQNCFVCKYSDCINDEF